MHVELMIMPEENPLLTEMLRDSGFSVSYGRTGNSFSRVGVDMALEQTINPEANSSVKKA